VDPYAWEIDPDTLIVVPAHLVAYLLLTRRFPASRLRWAAFLAAHCLILAVSNSPVNTLALKYLLSAHLLQNVVYAEWAPGLAVLGLPPAFAAWAARRRTVRVVTHPAIALPVWLATYFTWHVPALYDAALDHHTLLHLEHGCYFWTGVLVWWPVVHGRFHSGAKAAYLFAAFVLASPLGLLLALVPRAAYDTYVHAPERVWGLSPLADQQLAGVTMASEQAIVFFAVFALYFTRFLREQEELESATSDSS
jgi:cytochrome c oxidase assembly factor CtaG